MVRSGRLAQAAGDGGGVVPRTAAAADEIDHVGVRRASPGLDPTDAKVASLAAAGSTNAEIARQLDLTRRTVEANLSRVHAKLGVRSRAELAGRL